MYLPIEFECYSGDWNAINEEEYADLRSQIPSLPETKPENWCHGVYYITQDAFPVLGRLGIKFKVSQEEQRGVGQMLVKLQDRIDDLELKASRHDLAKLAQEGAAVQIAVPGFALMAINEVTVLDDCCTDELQSYLNDGWHILAVCPPNAQRRPDYVLGRNNHEVPN